MGSSCLAALSGRGNGKVTAVLTDELSISKHWYSIV